MKWMPLAIALLTALSASCATKPRTLLPGVADIPVVAGTPAPCPPTLTNAEGVACVLIGPLRAPNQSQQDAYAAAIERAGWKFSSGAANAFIYKRPSKKEGCVDILYFVGMPGAWKNNDVDPDSDLFYALKVEPQRECGS
jgi:hypothetical protein